MAVTAAFREVDARRDANGVIAKHGFETVESRGNKALHLDAEQSTCPWCSDMSSDELTFNAACNGQGQGRIRTRSQLCLGNSGLPEYTPCQIAQHNHADSCWIVAGNDVYDVTSYLRSGRHPGGEQCLLKKSGGVVDCSTDLNFHSKTGRRMWQRYRIGRVRSCPGQDSGKENDKTQQWWMFWL